jgi:hypothetical protein
MTNQQQQQQQDEGRGSFLFIPTSTTTTSTTSTTLALALVYRSMASSSINASSGSVSLCPEPLKMMILPSDLSDDAFVAISLLLPPLVDDEHQHDDVDDADDEEDVTMRHFLSVTRTKVCVKWPFAGVQVVRLFGCSVVRVLIEV